MIKIISNEVSHMPPARKILCNNIFNNTHEIKIILQNKTRSYTYESLYNYVAVIVRHNVLLAGNVFTAKSYPCNNRDHRSI